MKTFKLVNGDLSIGTSGHDMVEGTSKLLQDMGVTMREPFGSDRFHPRWGSLLVNYVGTPVGVETEMLVRAEIGRLVQNYISVQNYQIERDATTGLRARYSPNEVVVGVDYIQVRQEYDRYHIKVALRTLSGQPVSLVQTIEGS